MLQRRDLCQELWTLHVVLW